MRATWAVVVPVKTLAAAKTRLRGAVADAHHEALVLAMALDTVHAALAADGVAGVTVVTADPAVRAAGAAAGAALAYEPDSGGLNAALARGAADALGPALRSTLRSTLGSALRPTLGPARGRVVALPADLPALRPAELADALRTAATGPGPAYVADAAGTGTVLLTDAVAAALAPRFGPGSAAAHAAAGARHLTGAWPSLRHDVDTPADLLAAGRLGLGPRTAAVLSGGVTVGRTEGVTAVQGTVSEFDPATGAGAVLLDTGARVPFPAAAFAASGLRLLRVGQRVRLEPGGDGEIRRLGLVTMS